MDLRESQEKMRAFWDGRKYPTLVYVETTNFCNAKCTLCLYERMERPVRFMTVEEFKYVADRVKERGLKIGAMFCFGEPLADHRIFEKIEYGRSVGVMTDYLGLNTNSSYLTLEKFSKIVTHCNNITLSFVNTGKEFERLTGLSWAQCYGNAVNFISWRDAHRPDFNIQIGCNDVTGHNRDRVKAAFEGYDVNWARDAEIKWGGKIITGVIDRSIMYHSWVCDGLRGAIQIKPNGDCCFCAYDVIKSETKFANIYVDDWDTIEQNFKEAWKKPQGLCLRCDMWHNYWQMVEGGWTRGAHIDGSWQEEYLDD